MKRPEKYSTRQRSAVLEYVASLNGEETTAAKVTSHFCGADVAISRATVYRHLEDLVKMGRLRKYDMPGGAGACYEYLGEEPGKCESFRFKCEGCGELLKFSCDSLREIKRHIFDNHDFSVDVMKTVISGKCRSCAHASICETV